MNVRANRQRLVSIHAPARGATSTPWWMKCFHTFQFTRPRGARRWGGISFCGRISFNSRAREGRDGVRGRMAPPRRGFNSRAREGRDWAAARRVVIAPSFNSRAREGRDVCPRGVRSQRRFQFTRPRGARQTGRQYIGIDAVSIHAPARGATSRLAFSRGESLFQFTRPRGARRPSLLPSQTLAGFNSRAREGRDRHKSTAQTRN